MSYPLILNSLGRIRYSLEVFDLVHFLNKVLSLLLTIPVSSGRNEVRNDARLGPHMLICAWALRNDTLSLANRSKFGVIALGLSKDLINGLKSSASMTNTFGGRGELVGAVVVG